MAKGQRKSNREAKKPKMTAAEKSKIASLSSSRPVSDTALQDVIKRGAKSRA